jgi:hypothetical protein
MHFDIAALANSALQTAGGVGSFFASNSQASANSVAAISPGIADAGLGENLREAIRRSVQVSCEKPMPPPSRGVAGEGASNDPATSVKKKRNRGPLSERARAANRANAAKSTGPKTDEGKAISALNAFQHGVCSEATILPGESELELEMLTAELADDYQPRGAIEQLLVGRLVSIAWKLRRLSMAEMDAGYSQQSRRREIFDEQMELMKIVPKAKPPKSMPDAESQGYEIFADDFRENGKPGKLQQITQLEMKLTGQMLAVIRQLVQMKKLRIAEAKAGLGEGVREVERPAGNASVPAGHFPSEADEDVGVPGKRNEAIREAKAQATDALVPKQGAVARNEAIRTTDTHAPIDQPQSGGSTIAWGASLGKAAAAFGSPEGATQDHATAEDSHHSESLLQSSESAATDPGVSRRPAAAALPQAMVEASRWDSNLDSLEVAPKSGGSPARNEAISDSTGRTGIDVPPLTPTLSPRTGERG